MKIIDGKKIANEIKEELKLGIVNNNLHPGLAIVMVGNDPASEIYVRNKLKACDEIGINGSLIKFNESNAEEEIIKKIELLNLDNKIDGIIVQCPLPNKFNEDKILNSVSYTKDVDGFGINSLGRLISSEPLFLSATPAGIIKMLEHENVDIEGKNVVIVGRSKIVGKPLALALLNKNATVTITHSKTKNLNEITSKADILVVAIGKDRFIKEDYIKEGAIVIDVGINRIDGKLYGDVDFDNIKEKCSYITPVPGGVGPMTIAMLLSNVVKSARLKKEKE
ncbi:MAG: bifunctional methylenetetrahydrofolate dehydrogenase/methenyltetrahydrofolate cyclohydrolase FolD [Firmicutes bacterium]|nr:bifunctional methylenetetrahydrofolate dehydrogenase/methenyltetrahydrofolate cyclohydrolase FolD [Bacillota bacterium]